MMTFSTAKCLVDNGYTWLAARAFYPTNTIAKTDEKVCKTLSNAKWAGFVYRDAYMIPCPKCSTSPAN